MTTAAAIPTYFREADPAFSLFRRAAAERIGTMLLVLAASAGGIAAVRSLPDQPAAAAFMIFVTLAGMVVALIEAFAQTSGGHYNPSLTGQQSRTSVRSLICTVAYVQAQILGGTVGGAAAAALWHVAPDSAGGFGWPGVASEFIASAGLILIVFGSSRSGHALSGPFATGTWPPRAKLAAPTASYASPALVAGALVTARRWALGIGSAVPCGSTEIAGAPTALLAVSVFSLANR